MAIEGVGETLMAKVGALVESALRGVKPEGEGESLHVSEHRAQALGREVARRTLQGMVDAAGTGYGGQRHVGRDGAAWIGNQQAIVAPHAVAILDFYHASDRLWKVVRALHTGQGAARAATAWSQKGIRNLYNGKVHPVIQELALHTSRFGPAAQGTSEEDPRKVIGDAPGTSSTMPHAWTTRTAEPTGTRLARAWQRAPVATWRGAE